MAFNFDDYPDADEKSAFDFDAYPDDKQQEPSVSQLESGARGVAQGASFGFADEATGVLEAAKDWLANDPKGFMANYQKHRDESRANYKAAEGANPTSYMAGQFGGALAPAILSGGTSIPALAAQGAAQGLGASEADLTQGDVSGAARDAAIGSAIGGAAGVAGKAISKIPFGKAASYVSDKLGDAAEKLAEKATGATGRQAEKFEEKAGRELLDRGLVKFGDSPEVIASRIGKASDEAGTAIQQALEELDAKGVTASVENVASAIEGRIRELSETPGNEKIINQLTAELDNLYGRGQSSLPISKGEIAKRNYQGQTNYSSPEAEKKASAQLASAFREEVEASALNADPALAGKFTEGKKTYGLLAPVKEAAEKRAAQLNQSPFGGLLDATAGLYGLSDPDSFSGKAALAIAGRRFITPRIASSGAVIADNLSDIVAKAPQLLGKFAKPLEEASARGGNSLAATHFILQQINPEYRKIANTPLDEEDERQ